MAWKISVCVLNPFLKEEDIPYAIKGLNTYSLRFDGKNPKHFMREWGAWKVFVKDEVLLKNIIGKKLVSDEFENIFKVLEKVHSASLHVLLSFSSCIKFLEVLLENYVLSNSIFLHLVIEDETDKNFLSEIERLLSKYPFLILASLSWRKSTFNENASWDETQKIYDEICFIQMQTGSTLQEYLLKCEEEWIPVEKIVPVSFINSQPLEDWDVFFILEDEIERIASITKALEVSIREEKKSEFNNYDVAFITKPLKNLSLCCVTAPYAIYENSFLLKREQWESLLKRFSDKEIRVVQLWNKKHLRLINKDFNNGESIVYDGHKKIRCENIVSWKGELLANENKILLKKFEECIDEFEMSMLGMETGDSNVLANYLDILKVSWCDSFIVDFWKGVVYSNLEFWKKELNSIDLHKILLHYFNE